MSDWTQKRFWKDASVVAEGEEYAVELDGRRLRTPAKAPLVVPSEALAKAVAEEWAAQDEAIDPTSMPATRMVNAAIDKVRVQHAEVAQMLADYGDSDLLCYRAEHPEGLVARQVESWDPPLDWAENTLGVRLQIATGVMYIPQKDQCLTRLSGRIHRLSAFQLAAFHDMVSLTGSLILGFAAADDWRPADEIWQISRVDDLWQQDQWGEDDEAMAAAEVKRLAFLHACRMFAIC